MAQRAGEALAASITRRASRQSYLTIRVLADRAYRWDAFALYAYFRWLDDTVDEVLPDTAARLAFVSGQRDLLARAVAGRPVLGARPEEDLLVGLVQRDTAGARRGADGAEPVAGAGVGPSECLVGALDAMLDVMEFDAARRGRADGQGELDAYTRSLAVAVTESLHHCIGHGCVSPHDETRYVAVTGAHVAHMLRDLVEDLQAGYLNVPIDVIGDHREAWEHDPGAVLADVHAPAVRDWVRERVELARSCFATGRAYLGRVGSARCRFAGHAYTARFEWVLDVIEQDGYLLRPGYPERSSLRGGLSVGVRSVRSALAGGRSPAQDGDLRRAAAR